MEIFIKTREYKNIVYNIINGICLVGTDIFDKLSDFVATCCERKNLTNVTQIIEVIFFVTLLCNAICHLSWRLGYRLGSKHFN